MLISISGYLAINKDQQSHCLFLISGFTAYFSEIVAYVVSSFSCFLRFVLRYSTQLVFIKYGC